MRKLKVRCPKCGKEKEILVINDRAEAQICEKDDSKMFIVGAEV